MELLPGKLIQLAGLGKFVTGRRGQPSRVEWNPNAKSLIDTMCNSEAQKQILTKKAANNDFNQVTTIDPAPISNNYPLNTQVSTTEPKDYVEEYSLKSAIPKVIPSIAINVDMSEWNTDKIITFFKAIYGIFDDSKESNSSASCSQSFSELSDGHSDT